MVVKKHLLMPIWSCTTFSTGATQFVVQEPLETTRWVFLSYKCSFTPIINVAVFVGQTFSASHLQGAEMITRLAPASRCAAAFTGSVKNPVLSTTTSIFSFFHGSLAGSFSARTWTLFLPTASWLSV